MSYTVITTERAAREIEESAIWWAEHRSVEQAERWYLGIREAIGHLSKTFELCQLIPEQSQFGYELRELHYGAGSKAHATHRVIFTRVGKTIVVLTVRHAATRPLRPDDLTPQATE